MILSKIGIWIYYTHNIEQGNSPSSRSSKVNGYVCLSKTRCSWMQRYCSAVNSWAYEIESDFHIEVIPYAATLSALVLLPKARAWKPYLAPAGGPALYILVLSDWPHCVKTSTQLWSIRSRKPSLLSSILIGPPIRFVIDVKLKVNFSGFNSLVVTTYNILILSAKLCNTTKKNVTSGAEWHQSVLSIQQL